MSRKAAMMAITTGLRQRGPLRAMAGGMYHCGSAAPANWARWI